MTLSELLKNTLPAGLLKASLIVGAPVSPAPLDCSRSLISGMMLLIQMDNANSSDREVDVEA
jgi:hypothetical protein